MVAPCRARFRRSTNGVRAGRGDRAPGDFVMSGLNSRDALVAGSALAVGLALPGRTFAAPATAALYPSVARMVESYVASRRLPGMIAALGQGNGAAKALASGTQAFDSQQAM